MVVSFIEIKLEATISQMSSPLVMETFLDFSVWDHRKGTRKPVPAVPRRKLPKLDQTPLSCLSRQIANVSQIAKGLSKNDTALTLVEHHWLEAIDPLHRYGHNLHFYYEKWGQSQRRETFLDWLDREGKGVSLDDKCPRSKLDQQRITYFNPMERVNYEVIVENGKFYKQITKELLQAPGDNNKEWIFVLSTSKTLYVGEKKKAKFHHSSFLAGGAVVAAGKLVVENGILKV